MNAQWIQWLTQSPSVDVQSRDNAYEMSLVSFPLLIGRYCLREGNLKCSGEAFFSGIMFLPRLKKHDVSAHALYTRWRSLTVTGRLLVSVTVKFDNESPNNLLIR
jgi:hypothetical protein